MAAYNTDRLWDKYLYRIAYRKDLRMRSKITVVGAGFVGSTLVQRLVERDYADVVMYDIVANMPQGKALDMLQAGTVLGYYHPLVGANYFSYTAKLLILGIFSGVFRQTTTTPL